MARDCVGGESDFIHIDIGVGGGWFSSTTATSGKVSRVLGQSGIGVIGYYGYGKNVMYVCIYI